MGNCEEGHNAGDVLDFAQTKIFFEETRLILENQDRRPANYKFVPVYGEGVNNLDARK